MKRLMLLSALGAMALSGCSGSTPLAAVASSSGSIGVGTQRILIAMVDPETNAFLADLDAPATATLRDEDGTPLDTYDLQFVWTVPGERGIYVGYFDIPAPGGYQLTVEQEGYGATAPSGFEAVADPGVVGTGEPAPLTPTRTAGEFPDLSSITTDPDPDPDLYALSADEAITNGRPTVIVFATPGFCTTQACGPMLAQVKELKFDYPGVDFVHVEIYENLQVDDVNDLEVVAAVEDWRLPSEPWVFVVDAAGVVVAGLEGAFNDVELTSILDDLGA